MKKLEQNKKIIRERLQVKTDRRESDINVLES